jgi:UDP:flavonoid glycosyltransferase YjiC (YdhE family)
MHLEHGFGLPPPAGSIEHAMRELRRRVQDPGWRSIRTEQAPAYLDIVPPGLQAAGPPPNTVHAMRPIDAAGATSRSLPASWRRALESRAAKIHVTFGTVFNKRHALRVAVAAASRLDALVFVTVGRDGEPRDLGPLPSSVHVERFVDQAGLYAACDVALSHGGAGALLAAAAHGKPHVILRQAADHFRNARALEAAGAGVVVPPDGCTVEVVETALRAALDRPGVRHAAGCLAVEVAAMPGPEVVAMQIERGGMNVADRMPN